MWKRRQLQPEWKKTPVDPLCVNYHHYDLRPDQHQHSHRRLCPTRRRRRTGGSPRRRRRAAPREPKARDARSVGEWPDAAGWVARCSNSGPRAPPGRAMSRTARRSLRPVPKFEFNEHIVDNHQSENEILVHYLFLKHPVGSNVPLHSGTVKNYM